MKLYHSDTSPYVRKVMVALHLAGKAEAVDLVPGSGTPLDPNEGTCSANPLGKVPCLVTDDGLALFDSRVITRHLDATFGIGLYPEGDALWPVLAREALAEGILDAALLVVYEARLRPAELRFSPWVQGQMSKIHRALGVLEGEAGRFGEGFDAGLVAVACALGYLDLRFADLGWREGRPALAGWYEGVAEHPALVATRPA
ncbi:glutathione S-transferase [Paralimibaculum aggregatum]|uniref:Glutathione S-transferase n=1 Tax=Paralimibaculum aggregatum TaxID=3036245 RepID=A0ABQ6LNS8_9RHOB|nr:glutathione S-transferase C-terminal domain-containing protein [Limibaculum sp. NKW23]GMG84871.1 glutathione S-transferase [Limibaculum sp. NKW23]